MFMFSSATLAARVTLSVREGRFISSSLPSTTVEFPPGAQGNRGVGSGTSIDNSVSRWLKRSAGASEPSTTVELPPGAMAFALTGRTSFGSKSPPSITEL